MGQSKPIGTTTFTEDADQADTRIQRILSEIDQLVADGEKLTAKSLAEIQQRVFFAQEEEC